MTSISKIWKQLLSILSNLNNFQSLEVVDCVSETQFQVGENSDWIKGLRKVDVLSSIYLTKAGVHYSAPYQVADTTFHIQARGLIMFPLPCANVKAQQTFDVPSVGSKNWQTRGADFCKNLYTPQLAIICSWGVLGHAPLENFEI